MTLPNWEFPDLPLPEKTAARLAIVKPLWLGGKSASEITRYFEGTTRNAVIGLVNRAKLQRAKHKAAPNPVKRPAIKKPVAPKPIKPNRNTAVFGNPVFKPEPPMRFDAVNNDRPPLPGIDPISILQLPGRPGVRCRFPVQGGYCGAACGDKTYCEPHMALAYVVRK